MPKRNWFDSLPKDLRKKVEKVFIDGNFQNYVKLTNEINEILSKSGYEITIAQSTVHWQGKKFQKQIEGQQELLALARTARQELGEDEGEISDWIARTLQQKTYQVLTELEVEEGKVSLRDFAMLGRTIAAMNRTVVEQQRWQDELNLRAERAEQEVYELLRRGAQELEAKITALLGDLETALLDAGAADNKIKKKLKKYTTRIVALVKDEDGVYRPAGLSDQTVSDIKSKILGVPGGEVQS
ncbi:MAG: DUF3486 family protein [Gammaproteobacteria bacterium]|nr:DUF3486 family protein [Gammaproteobacteria bacterium]